MGAGSSFQRAAVKPAIRRWARVAALGVMLAAVPGGATVAGSVYEPSPEKIVDNFLRISFGQDLDAASKKSLIKWTGPIHAGIFGTNLGVLPLNLRSHLQHLTYLTGVDAEYITHGDLNLVIMVTPDVVEDMLNTHRTLTVKFFASEAEMERVVNVHRGKSLCYNVVYRHDAAIQKALVVIKAGMELATAYRCLIKSTVQALGFLHQDIGPEFSIFATGARFVDLTAQDMTFLRMLYDSRLKPGMSFDEVRRLAPEILRDIEARRNGQ